MIPASTTSDSKDTDLTPNSTNPSPLPTSPTHPNTPPPSSTDIVPTVVEKRRLESAFVHDSQVALALQGTAPLPPHARRDEEPWFRPDGTVDFSCLPGHSEQLYINPMQESAETNILNQIYLENGQPSIFERSRLGRRLRGLPVMKSTFPEGWEDWPVISLALPDGTVECKEPSAMNE